MDRLKKTLLEVQEHKVDLVENRVEVLGFTIASCLNRVAQHWNTNVISLDYEIIEKGKKSLLQQKPYHLEVSLLEEDSLADLSEFSMKLGLNDKLLDPSLDAYTKPKTIDAQAVIRNYRNGSFLYVFKAEGNGRPIEKEKVFLKIQKAKIKNYDEAKVNAIIKRASGEAEKIANFDHKIENDATCRIEMNSDNLNAYARINLPRQGGCHLQLKDIASALKSNNIIVGLREEEVEKALLADSFPQPILVAQGKPPKHGENARIDYKVNVKDSNLNLRKDSSGRVDFKNIDVIENVVVGQLLAEKIPATKGKKGYNLFNYPLEAKEGKDFPLKAGKGTILSDNGFRLVAEINGQVVLSRGNISVEPVYRVPGDVGPKTGNINFLGSVSVRGMVLKGFEVRASGNIEIHGGTQEALVEAEGNIVVRSGIQGGDVTSTNGSIVSKFIQDSKIFAAIDVLVSDGILRSKVYTNGNVNCNGRRAQIVGGFICARKDVRARIIGSSAYTATEIHVGTSPVHLLTYLKNKDTLSEIKEKIRLNAKLITTLTARKKVDTKGFTGNQQEKLQNTIEEQEGLKEQKEKLQTSIKRYDDDQNVSTTDSKISVERKLFPGVIVKILEAEYKVRDQFNGVTMTYDNKFIKVGKYEKEKYTGPSYQSFKTK